MLANFLGVLPILTPPLCALAFIMCSKSNPLVVFALDLMSAFEGEHTILILLFLYKSFSYWKNTKSRSSFSSATVKCLDSLRPQFL
jgi:hypothetical protein